MGELGAKISPVNVTQYRRRPYTCGKIRVLQRGDRLEKTEVGRLAYILNNVESIERLCQRNLEN